MPPLLKPAAQHWRAALARGARRPADAALPAPGAATLTADADPRGAALAYRRLGRDWLRIDLADRLASHARKVRSAGGDDPVDCGWRPRSGSTTKRIARLMAEVGFARPATRGAGAADASAPAIAAAGPSHAFAELAKLKRSREDRPLSALHPAGEEPHPCPGADRHRPRPHRRQARRKPSEEVRVGSVIAFPCTAQVRVLRVLGLPERRGPAAEARACYEELGIDERKPRDS